MKEVKQLFKLEQSIYTIYATIANNELTQEELKGYYTLLKILGYKKEMFIKNLEDKKISQISVTLEKASETIANNTQLSFVDFLYYPANEEKEKVCLETLKREILIENAKRKKNSLNETIATYYESQYFNKKAEYYYDCMFFKNLCSLYKENKGEIYDFDLKYLKIIYGYLINPTIYKSLVEKNAFEEIILEDMQMCHETQLQPMSDAILFDLLEDDIEEIEDLVETLQEQQEDTIDFNDEEELEENDHITKQMFLDGTSREIEPERISSMKIDPIFFNMHYMITQGILPYFLKIPTNKYTGSNEFCAYICFNYIKTYTQMDFDEINRKEIIRKSARKHVNYDNKKFKMGRNLIDSICERPKEYKKENNS